MDISDVLKIKFPGIDLDKDVSLRDHSDGRGIIIGAWNRQEPMPSPNDLANWLLDPVVIQQYTFQQNALLNIPIIAQLDAIDVQSIRALREPGTASTTKLAALTQQAAALRAQLLPTK